MDDDDAATTSSSDNTRQIIHGVPRKTSRAQAIGHIAVEEICTLTLSDRHIYVNEMDPFWLYNSIVAYDPISVVKFDTFLEVLVVGTNDWIRVF